MSNWIEGFDVSHWNGKDAVHKIILDNPEMKFCVIKCTEGISYKDKQAYANALAASKHNLVYGLYHFARAERNSPDAEAVFFASNAHAIAEKVGNTPFLVLDWESESIIKGEVWAAEFIEKVTELTDCIPMVYCSASVVPKIKNLEKLNCGIWIANRTGKEPNPAPWKTVTMWQYSEKPFDKDRFHGSKEQLKKYCAPLSWIFPKEDNSGGCHCGCSCCD